MRRAIVTTALTVAGLIALLDYKSSGVLSSAAASKTKVNTSATGVTGTSGATGTSGTAPSHDATRNPRRRSSSSSTTSPSSTGTSGSYMSPDVFYTYGEIQVRVAVADGRLTGVTVPTDDATDPRSESINSQAVPILEKEALAAQGVNIDVVSGATFTSDAFGQALKEALAKADK